MKRNPLILLTAVLFIAGVASAQFKAHPNYHFKIADFPTIPRIQQVALPTGVSLEYAEQGIKAGTTVLFVHGFTDSWLSFRGVMEALPSRIHCIALTQRGHGDSQHPDSGYQLKNFSEDIAALITRLNLGRVIIAGHSLGGLVAQRFAIDHPELVKGVMLLNTSANFSKKEMKDFARQVDGFEGKLPDGFAREFQASTLAKPMDPGYFDELVRESEKLPLFVWKQVLNSLANENLSKEVRRIRSRVRIIWGNRDLYCSREDQEELKGSIPRADMLVVDGAGHAAHWEQPGVIAAEVVAFVESFKK